jgi:hypothetical protein
MKTESNKNYKEVIKKERKTRNVSGVGMDDYFIGII